MSCDFDYLDFSLFRLPSSLTRTDNQDFANYFYETVKFNVIYYQDLRKLKNVG